MVMSSGDTPLLFVKFTSHPLSARIIVDKLCCAGEEGMVKMSEKELQVTSAPPPLSPLLLLLLLLP